MTEQEVDDLIDNLLAEIEDLEVKHSLARWAKSTLRQFDLSRVTPLDLSEMLEGLIDVEDVMIDVKQQIEQRLKPH